MIGNKASCLVLWEVKVMRNASKNLLAFFLKIKCLCGNCRAFFCNSRSDLLFLYVFFFLFSLLYNMMITWLTLKHASINTLCFTVCTRKDWRILVVLFCCSSLSTGRSVKFHLWLCLMASFIPVLLYACYANSMICYAMETLPDKISNAIRC